jgi:hypothetical protein
VTWLDWLEASFCFVAVTGLLTWAVADLHRNWPR